MGFIYYIVMAYYEYNKHNNNCKKNKNIDK